jgi:hypothetical protein
LLATLTLKDHNLQMLTWLTSWCSCESGWCLLWSRATICTKKRATPSVTRDSRSLQTTNMKFISLIRLILNKRNKKWYGQKRKLLLRRRDMVVKAQLLLMAKQQVERPSQFKAQKKNLASSLERWNILKSRWKNGEAI